MREAASGRAARAPVIVAMLFLLAVLPYLPGLRHAFVYDDHGQILENIFLTESGSWKRVLTLQTLNDASVINGRRPLVLLTYLLDHAKAPANPMAWRWTNLLFHAGSVIALFLLLMRVDQGRRTLFAFIAAWLFAWHPLLIEPVQVPSFRPDVLCGFFVLLYLHACVGGSRLVPWKMMALSTGALTLALLSKESALAALALPLLMWGLFPAVRPGRRIMMTVAGLSGVLALLFVWLGARPGPDGSQAEWQALGGLWNGRSLVFPDNLRTVPWLLWSYLRLMLWPFPLVADHVVTPVASWGSLRLWIPLMAFAGCAVWFFRLRQSHPWLLMGAGMTVILFGPVSNVIPLLNPFAERYAYFMTAGFCLIVAEVLAGHGLGQGRWPRVRLATLAGLLVVYALLTQLRLPDWRDDYALWSKTLKDQPASSRAHTWVGLSLKADQQLVVAMEYFARARQLNPRDAAPVVNMAVLYAGAEDYARAADLFEEAARLRPGYAPIMWNLGLALQYAGRPEEAERQYDDLLAQHPGHEQARKMRMVLLIARGAYEAALQDVLWLEQHRPGDPETRAAAAYVRERLLPGD